MVRATGGPLAPPLPAPHFTPLHRTRVHSARLTPTAPLPHSGRNVVEEKIWPRCEEAGVSLLWLPTRSPWCAIPPPSSAHLRSPPPPSAPPPPPPPPLAFHHGRFNPIEKFNGWLKGNVADDIAHGREGATRDNIIEAVHSAIAHRSADLPKKCQGWIDYLFAPSGG
jgi:hypothetical protein